MVFALATGAKPLAERPSASRALALLDLGSRAADALARAIARGVYAADAGLAGRPPPLARRRRGRRLAPINPTR